MDSTISIKLTKFFPLLTLVILIFAACSSAPAEIDVDHSITSDNPALHELETPIKGEKTPVETSENIGQLPAKSTITSQFQSIYLDPEQVKIISSEMVEWPDSCLGIEQLGVDCTPENTPGYAVVLEANGLQFAYHSNEVGSQVHPATPGLIWTRDDGGISVCDRLIIFLPDTAYICWCDEGETHAVSVNLQEILSEEEYQLFIDSLTTFSQNTVNQTSSAETNPVMVSLTFHGQGNTFPSAKQQKSLVSMAELIFDRITP